jgi:hypothetical protein
VNIKTIDYQILEPNKQIRRGKLSLLGAFSLEFSRNAGKKPNLKIERGCLKSPFGSILKTLPRPLGRGQCLSTER